MWDYLSAPVDADRAHQISDLQLWHARLMFLAWGILAPLAVITARFFKVLPGQDWPNRLDSQIWWRCHWIGQSIVLLLTVAAVCLVYQSSTHAQHWHSWLGYTVMTLVVVQALFGYFRGTKGGPTDPHPDGTLEGDHYSMTAHRRVFEMLHKLLGYTSLLVAAVTIFFGLWLANSPRWMWAVVVLWWLVLCSVFVVFQRRGMAFDTYQAIWGPDSLHPGNKLPVRWGMNRHKVIQKAAAHKRTE